MNKYLTETLQRFEQHLAGVSVAKKVELYNRDLSTILIRFTVDNTTYSTFKVKKPPYVIKKKDRIEFLQALDRIQRLAVFNQYIFCKLFNVSQATVSKSITEALVNQDTT